MTWHTISRDGIALHGRDQGTGLPVVFQHGLGGNEAQVAEVFPDDAGFRRLTLDCRGQGRSPEGDPRALSIAAFAGDVLAFADQRGLRRFAVGGISMGAAIALHLAIRHPQRILGLVLARPAWLWDAAPANMQPFAEVARLLRSPDIAQARIAFERSETGHRLAQTAPDNLASLLGFFDAENPAALAALLAAIAADGPGVSEAEVRRIAIPTLVLGTAVDAVHPIDTAHQLAACIPGARFQALTPKSTDRARYVREFRMTLADFLTGLAHTEGNAA